MSTEKLNGLVVFPIHNQIKNDALGAFVPEAHAFQRFHAERIAFDAFAFDPKHVRKEDFFDTLKAKPYDIIAIFSHGLWNKLPQLHVGLDDIPEMVNCITAKRVNLIFYCCLLAQPKDEPNFAQLTANCLELSMSGRKFDLWAHRTAGHTTKNPQITHYSSDNGLASVIEYPSCLKNYGTKFAKVMREEKNPLRFCYPFSQSSFETMREVVEWTTKEPI